MPLRMVSPVATPAQLSDLLLGMQALVRPDEHLERFRNDLKKFLKVEHCYLVSSGRAALYLVLKVLSDLSDRKEVVLPAYICPAVVSAVLKLGLKAVFCDISFKTLDLDLEQLPYCLSKNTLAVVPAHLFGLPCDMDKILEIVKGTGIFVLEDAAQALGASINGRMVGTIGDVGIFSFNRGKSLDLLSGGLIVTNSDELSSRLSKYLSDLEKPGAVDHIFSWLRLTLYNLMIRPELAIFKPSFVASLYERLRTDYRVEEFKVSSFDSLLALIGTALLKRLKDFNRIRAKNACYLKGILESQKGALIEMPEIVNGAEPVYVRLPVIFREKELVNLFYKRLLNQGVVSSRLYTRERHFQAIQEAIGLTASYPKVAQYVSERLVALPTHPLMTERDLEIISSVFRSVSSERQTNAQI